MKPIITYLKNFWKTDFDFPVYALAAGSLAVAIYFNYRYDFEDSILDAYRRQPVSLLYYLLYYGVAYYFVIGLYLLLRRKIPALSDWRFWAKSLFVLALIGWRGYFYPDQNWLPSGLTLGERYAYLRIARGLVGTGIFAVGLAMYYLFLEQEKKYWYGLTTKGFNWRPYAIMLAIMIPLIALAATQPDFLKAYPRLKLSYFKEDYWQYFAMYEPVYLLEFVMVEWIFRGFLVIGMVRLIGHRAVLPMAVLYCVFHFGKPLGECVSSFFGGYILGVFAYYSRSVWGGIIVHMGIALLMDLAALIAWVGFAGG